MKHLNYFGDNFKSSTHHSNQKSIVFCFDAGIKTKYLTAQQLNSSTAQQLNSSTAQQLNSSTAQQLNSSNRACRHLSLLILMLLFCTNTFYGQTPSFVCGMDQANNRLNITHPNLYKIMDCETDCHCESQDPSNIPTYSSIPPIPVVVHIISHPEQGASPFITPTTVAALIGTPNVANTTSLNGIFATQQNSMNIPAASQIRFQFASQDPSGRATTGINTIMSSHFNDFRLEDFLWDPEHYYNIVIVKDLCEDGFLPCTNCNTDLYNTDLLSGYSFYAKSHCLAWDEFDSGTLSSPNVCKIGDATVMQAEPGNANLFLSVGLLAHETGHYLDLLHTFSPNVDNNGYSNLTYMDGTPITYFNVVLDDINTVTFVENNITYTFTQALSPNNTYTCNTPPYNGITFNLYDYYLQGGIYNQIKIQSVTIGTAPNTQVYPTFDPTNTNFSPNPNQVYYSGGKLIYFQAGDTFPFQPLTVLQHPHHLANNPGQMIDQNYAMNCNNVLNNNYTPVFNLPGTTTVVTSVSVAENDDSFILENLSPGFIANNLSCSTNIDNCNLPNWEDLCHAGDKITDTAPHGWFNSQTGALTTDGGCNDYVDCTGAVVTQVPANAPTDNYMSYNYQCYSNFTDNQVRVMQCALREFRSFLIDADSNYPLDPPLPINSNVIEVWDGVWRGINGIHVVPRGTILIIKNSTIEFYNQNSGIRVSAGAGLIIKENTVLKGFGELSDDNNCRDVWRGITGDVNFGLLTPTAHQANTHTIEDYLALNATPINHFCSHTTPTVDFTSDYLDSKYSTIIVHNSTIRDAITGIGPNSTHGRSGIIQAINSKFYDNQTSIWLNNYSFSSSINRNIVRGNHFVNGSHFIANDNITAVPLGTGANKYIAQLRLADYRSESVASARIEGNVFEACIETVAPSSEGFWFPWYSPDPDDRGIGILSANSSYMIISNRFINLWEGIESNASTLNTSTKFILNNEYFNCWRSITLSGMQMSFVANNEITVHADHPTNTQWTSFGLGLTASNQNTIFNNIILASSGTASTAIGLDNTTTLAGSSAGTILDNMINKSSFSFDLPNLINSFTPLSVATNAGMFIVGTQFLGSNAFLDINCNEYDKCSTDWNFAPNSLVYQSSVYNGVNFTTTYYIGPKISELEQPTAPSLRHNEWSVNNNNFHIDNRGTAFYYVRDNIAPAAPSLFPLDDLFTSDYDKPIDEEDFELGPQQNCVDFSTCELLWVRHGINHLGGAKLYMIFDGDLSNVAFPFNYTHSLYPLPPCTAANVTMTGACPDLTVCPLQYTCPEYTIIRVNNTTPAPVPNNPCDAAIFDTHIVGSSSSGCNFSLMGANSSIPEDYGKTGEEDNIENLELLTDKLLNESLRRIDKYEGRASADSFLMNDTRPLALWTSVGNKLEDFEIEEATSLLEDIDPETALEEQLLEIYEIVLDSLDGTGKMEQNLEVLESLTNSTYILAKVAAESQLTNLLGNSYPRDYKYRPTDNSNTLGNLQGGLTFLPNPANSSVSIMDENGDQLKGLYRLEIYNMSGKILHIQNDYFGTKLNIKDFNDGIYIVKLVGESMVRDGKLLIYKEQK